MWSPLLFLAAGSCLLSLTTPAIVSSADPQTVTKNIVKNSLPEQATELETTPGNLQNASLSKNLYDLTVELRTLNQLFRNYITTLSCPAPFHMLGSECFAFLLDDMPWETARTKCLQMGADLAEPADLTQLRLYVGNRFPRKSARNFWIGGHSQDKIWSWLSGESIDDRFWHTNEPSGNGECLGMFDGWEEPLTDFPCENERRAVCEKPLVK
ncbi:type-2 ice-structuring protein-like [Penaeus indicus]|uniref:type-2 ice-structuring protein-like n=1 Tax=Penaeus indicus TaxID=29960 RepID=UPI00300D201E